MIGGNPRKSAKPFNSTRLCNIYNVFTHPGHVLLWTSTFCPICHFIIKTFVFVNVDVDVDVDVSVDVDADADDDDDVDDDDDGCYRCRIYIFPVFSNAKANAKELKSIKDRL